MCKPVQRARPVFKQLFYLLRLFWEFHLYGFVTKGGYRTSRGTSAALERGAPTIETFFKFSEKNYMQLKKIWSMRGRGCASRSTICCDDYTSSRCCLCKRSKTMLIPEFAFDWTFPIHVILYSFQFF